MKTTSKKFTQDQIDQFVFILENQLEALHNNQFDFLLYSSGAGGEFLSTKIMEYSPNYNLKIHSTIIETGRYCNEVNLLCKVGSHQFYNIFYANKLLNIDHLLEIDKQFNHSNLEDFLNNKEHYLILDNHLQSGGRAILRCHYVLTKYMNRNNSFYLECDTKYFAQYRKKMCFMKIQRFLDSSFNNFCSTKFYGDKQIKDFKKIKLSKIFDNKYLQDMFNISDPQFHKDIMEWHHRNKKLIEEYDRTYQ